MPIEVAIWRLGKKLEKINFSAIESEAKLEDVLADDLSLLSPDLMLIGRQIPTAFGKFIDMLAIDSEGNLTVIELKRNRTPRDVVAQLLDYASWVEGLSYDDVAEIYADKNPGHEFEKGFAEVFGSSPPEKINEAHELVIVSSELDPSTERIIGYLGSNFGVPVNAVFFRYFKDGEREYLARTWLIDPQEAEAKASQAARKKREPWNGRNFYVCLGEDDQRNWDDCRRYGFVSGGGGKWYIQTLKHLFPSARVFANIPGRGFVGVGEVLEEVVPVNKFTIDLNGKDVPILKAPLETRDMGKDADDPELSEHLVRVKWIKAVDREEAYWEKGLFANQLTACRLRNQFTIDRLTQHFGLDD